MRVVSGLILFLLILTSCKKEPSPIPYTKYDLPVNTAFRDVHVFNSEKIIICGGHENYGNILSSSDGGISWTQSTGSFDHPLNSIYFINPDTGFCADSDIIIRRTTDGGVTWTPFYDTTWPLTVNRNLRSIWFSNSTKGFVCGGKNLGNGVMYKTSDSGEDWIWSEYEHEYRAICFTDSLNGLMCGYGSLLLTNNGGNTFYDSGIDQHFFTGAVTDLYGNYWLCDFNGKILTSSNKGISWTTKRDGSNWRPGTGQLNTIAVSSSGIIAAAGPNGFITWSSDNGQSWNEAVSFGESDIYRIKWLSGNELICTGKNGVFRITL